MQPDVESGTFFLCSRQLTVGLYEFEVTVEGEGAHGKGYVNVTVKPGECGKKKQYFSSLAILWGFHFSWIEMFCYFHLECSYKLYAVL